ncbi:MAG: DHH family phosphoesterase [Planctomycetota bacterium]
MTDDYSANLTLPAAANALLDADGPALVLTHAKPDGDALGSVLALVTTLRGLGRPCRGLLVPPIPDALRNLDGADTLDVFEPADPSGVEAAIDAALDPEPTQIVIVDTGAYSQLGPLRAVVEPRLHQTLIIDHHLSGDVPAPRRLIDGTAAATCEIVAELIELMVEPRVPPGRRQTDTAGYKPLPPVTRDALFVGIASDTGWFRFSNTSPATHELAARLLRMGTDAAGLYQRLEQAERPEKLNLLCRAVSNLHLLPEHHAAVMVLRASDFEQTGARPDETERLVDIPQIVDDVQVVVLVTEHEVADANGGKHPQTKMSFRSKPAPLDAGTDRAVNVARLAAKFGGGGHARAAGAKVDRPIDDVVPDVLAALREL